MKRFLIFAALILAAPTAMAQEGTISAFEVRMLHEGARGQTIAKFEAQMRQNFVRWEADGIPGYTQADADILDRIEFAAARTRVMTGMLNDDLDGDFQITTDELRIQAVRRASAPLRANGTEIAPSPEQIKLLSDRFLQESLTKDTNGDGVISQDEIATAAKERAEQQLSRRGSDVRRPDMGFDTNGDNRLTEDEFVGRMVALAKSLDTNGDGQLTREEIRSLTEQAMRERASKTQADRVREYMERAGVRKPQSKGSFSQARAACTMPAAPEGTEVIVVGGYEGAALTDIWLGKKNTTELVDISVPAGDAPIYLIAPFFRDTILRLDDPSGRVANVMTMQGQIGVIGGGDGLTIQAVDDACRLEVYLPVTAENPDPAMFYAEKVGQPIAIVVRGYTLGRVNLTSASNTVGPMSGSVAAPASETAKPAWDKFIAFNPGGFVSLDPATITAAVPKGRHDVWPQYAGISALVAEGALLPLPRADTSRTVLESDAGEIRMQGKTFIPGSGDDAIMMGGLIFTEERPKTWIGRKPQVYLMTRPVTLPVGLTGAHGLHLAVPEGMAKPENAPSGVKIIDLTAEAFSRLLKK